MKEISYQIFLDADNLEKLRIKIHTDKGKILDIVVQKGKTNHPYHYVGRCFEYAEQDIKDRWEFYKERYLKKLKL